MPTFKSKNKPAAVAVSIVLATSWMGVALNATAAENGQPDPYDLEFECPYYAEVNQELLETDSRSEGRKILNQVAVADADGNGMLTPSEARRVPMLRYRFIDADKDGDRQISPIELVEWMSNEAKTRLNEMIASVDSNSDGMMSKVEADRLKLSSDDFKTIDADGDMQVTTQEIWKYWARKELQG